MQLEEFLKNVTQQQQDIMKLTEAPYNLSVMHQVDADGAGAYVIDYNQITSPRFDELVDRCRGIVVDDTDFKVVCNTFKRFYNAGEDPRTEDFCFTNSLSYEKVDGSLIKVYYYRNKWRIGTRGTAFANNTLTSFDGVDGKITFKNLFLKTLNVTPEVFEDTMNEYCDQNSTYLFELCTQENRVVTQYPTNRVYLIGAIDKYELVDHHAMDLLWLFNLLRLEFDELYFPSYTEHESIDSVIEHAESLSDLKEGFVLCEGALHEDESSFRFRSSSDFFSFAYRIRGNGLTPKRVFDLVYANEHLEFLAYYPEYQKHFDIYVEKYDNIKKEIGDVFESIKHIDDRKEYASYATKYRFSSFLFSMKQRGYSLETCLAEVHINYLYSLMDIK